MASAPRTYGGVDASARTAQRRGALLDAGLDLLGASEPEVSVRGVCRRARVTSRYFYESFSDAGELVEAVYDRVVDAIATDIAVAVAEAGPTAAERVRAAVQVVVGAVADDPRQGRLLFSSASGHHILAAKREQSTTMFTRLLAEQAGEHFGTAADGRVTVAARFVVGGFAQVLTAWLDGSLDMSEDDVRAHCETLLLAVGTVMDASPRH